jgi:hypothetical protein
MDCIVVNLYPQFFITNIHKMRGSGGVGEADGLDGAQKGHAMGLDILGREAMDKRCTL